MKKILALLLIGVMVIAFVGCKESHRRVSVRIVAHGHYGHHCGNHCNYYVRPVIIHHRPPPVIIHRRPSIIHHRSPVIIHKGSSHRGLSNMRRGSGRHH